MSRNDSPGPNRRQLLRATGAAGVVGLAGCAGGGDGADGDGGDGGGTGNESDDSGDGDGETETTTESGDPVDPTFTAAMWTNPTSAQYNSYNQKNYPGLVALILYDQLARYDRVSQEFVPLALSEWDIDLDAMTVTLTLVDGYTWHDGTPLRAKDLHGMILLDMLTNAPYTEHFESASVVDDRTVEASLAVKVNPDILKFQMLSNRLDVHYKTYEDLITQADEATSESERTAVQEKLVERKLDEPMGNGPFKYESAGEQRTLLSKHEGYHTAESLNFPNYEFRFLSGNQKNWQAMKSGVTDGTTFFAPTDVAQGFPDSVVHTLHPSFWGFGIGFKHTDPVFGDVRVRKAVAYAIDRSVVAENSGGKTKVPVGIPTGIPGNFSETATDWLGDSKDAFEEYPQNREKASELMREAGYSKESGNWVHEDGSAVKAPLAAPAGWSDWVTAAQTSVSHLKQFGFKANMQTISSQNFYSKIYTDGDFRIASMGWGAGRPYPYFGFRSAFARDAAVKSQEYPAEVTVPPLGKPDGEPRTAKPREKVEALAAKPGQADRLIKELAWVFNRDLPLLPVQEKLSNAWTTKDDWEIPPKDSDAMKLNAPYWWLPRVGKLQAKTE